jgi:hypothetical protein
MRALVLAVMVCALSGCGAREEAVLAEPPASLEDGWRRTAYTRVPAAEAPELLRSLGVRDALRAEYSLGAARVAVEAYLLPAEGGAFEARQKFQPRPGQLTFHNGRAFAACAPDGLDSKALIAFARGLEAAWFRSRP